MEEYDVHYAPQAVDDLRGIYAYISQSLLEPNTALKQTQRIRESVRSLQTMPARYPLAEFEPWHSLGIRKLPIDNYVVFYLVNAELHTVTVYRIFYGSRNIPEIIQK